MASHETAKQGESPVIIKPTNQELVNRLKAKSNEYNQRLMGYGEFTHPEQLLIETFLRGESGALDSMLKARLLSKVLSESQVRIWDFQEEIIADPLFEVPLQLNHDLFVATMLNACLVVNAYCSDTAELVRGGTGL